ncbi:uncharacterized protein LOC115742148 [Rhodamnia argentea]|uniref:Uncharacterized protein LOC115742148 n=1 Tax=Rhodamnia argentea TaxID=178133 RepID=A0ABM3GVH1_9MYRT|nr:uncharacterized protein LOC115742148 [Rhodamnia argentea]
MRGVVSQGRLTPSPSPSSSPSVSSSPSPSLNPQQVHADGQHRHIGPSSVPQEHIREQLGHMRSECPSAPSPSAPSSMQHSNDEGGEEDSRLIICPYGDSFTDATYVVRQLNKIVNNYWRGPWNSYGSAPKQVKDLWWNEFKRKFSWDETEEDEVRRIFKKKAGDHIRNVMNKAKRSQGKPDFIIGDDWTEIKRIWESEKNMQRSEQNKKNRGF